ncbi:hypothetical protein OK074_2646 [Actinobacteria bacterium OK074]|nr:hypothetical protein OK074_2646 [Actinobacteria bacterium OK074]
MAECQSNARPCAHTGAHATSGVIHIRTRHTTDFTVIANSLLQRRGSAVTVGVAAYICSLPDGALVSIAALCAHFDEGEILISRALRELEAAGYLERRRERTPHGRIITRTYFYDVPAAARREPPPSTPADAVVEPTPSNKAPVEPPAPADAAAPPEAVAVLTALCRVDRRLILSRREVAQLAPAVGEWLARGLAPEDVTDHLTTGLPPQFRSRPARILAFRLAEIPHAAPPSAPARPTVHPWQTCDGCERAFRAPEAGPCRDCRRAEELSVAC